MVSICQNRKFYKFRTINLNIKIQQYPIFDLFFIPLVGGSSLIDRRKEDTFRISAFLYIFKWRLIVLLSEFEYNITYQWLNTLRKLSIASRLQWKAYSSSTIMEELCELPSNSTKNKVSLHKFRRWLCKVHLPSYKKGKEHDQRSRPHQWSHFLKNQNQKLRNISHSR